ncbi:hypothetical protein A1O1_07149 [Capronia coronata CBS 617.96]|uniref:Uncharacterized protein n=1 Tax=Capronia coronata CBS 617.96 TaxID=1182541 RepID=W9Y2R9_9EURO|nr:uncharacterized protein A1O1_07149 [Capronia coronata CBS 617.96]EXJ83526.1 hypothetical protein A1O1_07149 [Capronia coronata CBS 617.96]
MCRARVRRPSRIWHTILPQYTPNTTVPDPLSTALLTPYLPIVVRPLSWSALFTGILEERPSPPSSPSLIIRLAGDLFGRSLSDPTHPWIQRGYNPELAHRPRSPSEDPYSEVSYQHAFHSLVIHGLDRVPNPLHYVHSPTAKEVLTFRLLELFSPRVWPPGEDPTRPAEEQQQEQQQEQSFHDQQQQQQYHLPQNQWQPQPQPQQAPPTPLPAAFAPPVTPTMEEATPRPHEMLPSPKYKDETPRSSDKKPKREHKSSASSSSSGPRPWNKRKDIQPTTPKPLLPAATRSSAPPQQQQPPASVLETAPEPHPSLVANSQMTGTDVQMTGMDPHPATSDHHELPLPSEQYPPVPPEGDQSPADSGGISFLEPRLEPPPGPPRMLR